MSYNVLTDKNRKHTAADDLESIFYVFFWICVMFKGPGGKPRSGRIPHFIKTWIYSGDFREIASSKFTLLASSADYRDKLFFDYVMPYFNDLRPCLAELRELFHPENIKLNPPTHDKFIFILEKAKLQLLPELTTIKTSPGKAQYRSRGHVPHGRHRRLRRALRDPETAR